MNEIETLFLDEYKRVDAICRDLFRGDRYYRTDGQELFGVSAYLAAMNEVPYARRARFDSWDVEYDRIKRLRDLRNSITHDIAASACSYDDLESLEAFHRQLVGATDPYAAYCRAQREAERQKTAAAQTASVYYEVHCPESTVSPPCQGTPAPKKTGNRLLFALLVGVGAGLAVFLAILIATLVFR
jgi:hypothetical protein